MNGQDSKPGNHMLVEADVGSGERTPGQEDTDKIIEQIGQDDKNRLPADKPLPGSGKTKAEQGA